MAREELPANPVYRRSLTALAFADLPDATLPQYLGQWVFVTDGLKAAETTGTGTGAMAASDGTIWFTPQTGLAVEA